MRDWRDDLEQSEKTKDLVKQLNLKGESAKRIDGILTFTQNLGEYEDFLTHLKGKKGRKQLYDSIIEDINRHIWHKDLGETEPMPKGWRV